jgi:hypothetical protein
MFYTPTTAIAAFDDILNQLYNDELFDGDVGGETIVAVREALHALQAEEAREEAEEDGDDFWNREGQPEFNGAFTSW